MTRSPNQVLKKYNHERVTPIRTLDDIKKNLQINYVINLAGESIGSRRWTDSRKENLINSRVKTTEQLTHWLDTHNIKPKCIISGSAVGYYGVDQNKTWQKICDEDTPPQHIFISEICQKWEQAILPWALERQQNIKIIRLGVVFAQQAPAFKQMLLPIKLNSVGKIGSGQQPLSWVHIDDVVNAIVFLMKSPTQHKIYNLSAPQHITQQQFVHTCKKILHKYTPLSLPEIILKLILNEQAELITNGQFVTPKHLNDEGYQFKYPALDQALHDLLT